MPAESLPEQATEFLGIESASEAIVIGTVAVIGAIVAYKAFQNLTGIGKR